MIEKNVDDLYSFYLNSLDDTIRRKLDKDQYGRIVGVIYYNGMNINLYILETGNAWWYKQYSKHNIKFKIEEENIRFEKLGL